MVYDRWRWLRRRLPAPRRRMRLLDVGCGSGAFSIGAGLRGYSAVGLTWDDAQTAKARARAEALNADAQFEVCDVRQLDRYNPNHAQYDIIICCEVIEHIIDDAKLIRDMGAMLKPGGRLLLTTPNYYCYRLGRGDFLPLSVAEDGGHVKRGYTFDEMHELMEAAGLRVESSDWISGILSQGATSLLRFGGRLNYVFGQILILPLRIMIPWVDRGFTSLGRWQFASIGIVARKPQSTSNYEVSSQ